MSRLARLCLVLLLLGVAASRVRAAEPAAHESISFAIEKFPVQQQGPQVVDLAVRLDYAPGLTPKDYPDFEEVYRQLEGWMTHYPAKNDYWEVFNRHLCEDVLAHYTMLAGVTLELTVHPTFSVPYAQTIRTTLAR